MFPSIPPVGRSGSATSNQRNQRGSGNGSVEKGESSKSKASSNEAPPEGYPINGAQMSPSAPITAGRSALNAPPPTNGESSRQHRGNTSSGGEGSGSASANVKRDLGARPKEKSSHHHHKHHRGNRGGSKSKETKVDMPSAEGGSEGSGRKIPYKKILVGALIMGGGGAARYLMSSSGSGGASSSLVGAGPGGPGGGPELLPPVGTHSPGHRRDLRDVSRINNPEPTPQLNQGGLTIPPPVYTQTPEDVTQGEAWIDAATGGSEPEGAGHSRERREVDFLRWRDGDMSKCIKQQTWTELWYYQWKVREYENQCEIPVTFNFKKTYGDHKDQEVTLKQGEKVKVWNRWNEQDSVETTHTSIDTTHVPKTQVTVSVSGTEPVLQGTVSPQEERYAELQLAFNMDQARMDAAALGQEVTVQELYNVASVLDLSSDEVDRIVNGRPPYILPENARAILSNPATVGPDRYQVDRSRITVSVTLSSEQVHRYIHLFGGGSDIPSTDELRDLFSIQASDSRGFFTLVPERVSVRYDGSYIFTARGNQYNLQDGQTLDVQLLPGPMPEINIRSDE